MLSSLFFSLITFQVGSSGLFLKLFQLLTSLWAWLYCHAKFKKAQVKIDLCVPQNVNNSPFSTASNTRLFKDTFAYINIHAAKPFYSPKMEIIIKWYFLPDLLSTHSWRRRMINFKYQTKSFLTDLRICLPQSMDHSTLFIWNFTHICC